MGEVVQMTDFEGEAHLGVFHKLQRGVPFEYDPGRLHCVTEWRRRRAVLHAYSSGMENHLGAVERRSLEAAGFPIFAPEEDFYPKVNVMQVEVPDDDRAEGQEMNWDVVEPILEESHHGVNASFVDLRLAVQQPGNPGVNGHVQWEAGTVQSQGASMFKVGVTKASKRCWKVFQCSGLLLPDAEFKNGASRAW